MIKNLAKIQSDVDHTFREAITKVEKLVKDYPINIEPQVVLSEDPEYDIKGTRAGDSVMAGWYATIEIDLPNSEDSSEGVLRCGYAYTAPLTVSAEVSDDGESYGHISDADLDSVDDIVKDILGFVEDASDAYDDEKVDEDEGTTTEFWSVPEKEYSGREAEESYYEYTGLSQKNIDALRDLCTKVGDVVHGI